MRSPLAVEALACGDAQEALAKVEVFVIDRREFELVRQILEELAELEMAEETFGRSLPPCVQRPVTQPSPQRALD